MPRIGLFARGALRKPLADLVRSVGSVPLVFPQPVDGKELRYFAHQKQPDAVIVDVGMGDGWDPVKALPRLALVKNSPKVIAIFARLTQRERRRAMMAGASVVIDGAAPSWRDDLLAGIVWVRFRQRTRRHVDSVAPSSSAPPVLKIVSSQGLRRTEELDRAG